MEVAENTGFVYEFGTFALDPKERTLYSNGVPLHLPAKEFETLVLLVENNGKALSKEEMISAIWQDAFVEEGNLAKQISKLRKIINTNGNQFIETMPKHGYRFSADLRRAIVKAPTESNGELPIVVEDPPTNMALQPAKRRPSGRLWIVGLLAVAILVIGGVSWLFLIPADPQRIRSVAVLPLRNLDRADDRKFLSAGITDSLITRLGSLKSIVVRPIGSVRSFQNEDGVDAVAAGRTLKVDAVLDASIQESAGRVRINARLLDTATGEQIWSQTFDGFLTNIFDLHDRLAEHVAIAVAPELTSDERRLLAKRFTTNAAAHEAYVKGRYFWNRRTGNDLKEAIKYFTEAIEKDPAYALAYVGLADANVLLADYAAAPVKESYEKARDAAQKALELDEGLAEAHTSLAYVKMYYYWDWAGAENGYRRALELNPNYATAHQWYSEYLTAMGRFDEALAEIRRAREIDPLSPVVNAGETWILYFAHRYDDAIAHGKKLIETNPEFAEIHEYLKRCYDQKGMYSDAITSRQMRRKLAGFDAAETTAVSNAAAATSHEQYWRARLEQELEDIKTEKPATFDLAEIYSQLGDRDKAFEWLEKAVDERLYTVMYLKVAPNLDPLRSDPRFSNFLQRVGLPN